MKKILIVENETAIRENTAELLELNNFRVLTAETAREGYEAAKKYLPDVILYNEKIPRVNGDNFLNFCKNEALIKHIPLVFFSDGLPSPGSRKQSGSEIYLEKPFTEEKLVHAITYALERIKP